MLGMVPRKIEDIATALVVIREIADWPYPLDNCRRAELRFAAALIENKTNAPRS